MIRTINDTDRDYIYSIIKREFDAEYSRDNPFSNWYVYEENNRIIGFINYDSIYEQAELEYIYVDKIYRNMGIATRLFETMITDLNNRNIHQITLEVRCDNESAISFYLKNGFEKVTIRKNYYKDIDAFMMLKSW